MKYRGFEVVKDSMRKTEGEVKLPVRGSKHSGAYDFYAPYDIVIPPHGTSGIVPTDVKAFMLHDEVLLLFIRSSVGIKKNLVLANSVAVIDSDYFENPDNDGNIGIALRNLSDEAVTIQKGERVVQGMFIKYLTATNDINMGERKGGYGSTGVK